MKIRRLKGKEAMLLICMALLCCAGCRQKETTNAFSELSWEEEPTEEVSELDGEEEKADADHNTANSEEKSVIYVYVCGAVNVPGVYELRQDARVYEAIACAGGVRSDAAEEAVNQAKSLTDGERIYIPTDEEAKVSGEGTGILESENTAGKDAGKVNINTASKEELKTLSGIGDTRAECIINYREKNGPFASIDELTQVEGIKEGVFQKIKDQITVQ